jgi:c-di-GMP-binding flagellar brake protein YcgR
MTVDDKLNQERRKFKRVRMRLRVVWRVKGHLESADVLSLNLSGGGMCIGLDKAVDTGDSFELKAVIGSERDVISCIGTVVWQDAKPVKDEAGNQYYPTGVQFDNLELKERMRLIHYCHNVSQSQA